MATKHIASIAVATEANYANILATTGVPSTAGLAFAKMEILDRAQLLPPGEPVLTERTGTRTGLYGMAPEPSTINDAAGDPIKRRRGTVVVDIPWRPIGDGSTIATYAALPLQRILLTGLETALESDTVADVIVSSADVNTVTVTTPGDFAEGHVVRWPKDGRLEYSGVTEVAASVLTLSPAMSAALSGNLYPMRTNFIPASGVPNAGVNVSVALRLDGHGWRSYCYGCTLTQIVITADADTHMVRASLTLDCAHIVDDHANAAPALPTFAAGHICHQLESYLVVGATGWTEFGGPTAAAAQDRATLCVDSFTLTVDLTRGYGVCGENITGRSGSEVTNAAVSLEVVTGGVTDTYDDDLWEGKYRNVVLGFAGGTPDTAGEGGCIMIPAAYLTTDPSLRDAGADHLRTKLMWSAGPYGGDDEVTDPANAILRIGMA